MDIIQGDCLEELKKLEDNSIDGCVTDPPAGISFMNKDWDHDKGGRDQWMKWMTDVFTEVQRVLKPGGHCLVWSIPRTSHWTGMALEDAGFEVRDCVYHIFGQGFPKSHNVGMGIDKKMKLIDHQAWAFNHAGKEGSQVYDKKQNYELNSSNGYFYKGKSEEAKKYDGYGSQLKPAVECWWLIRKPFKGSIVDNVLEYGTGGLNIDKSRIPTDDNLSLRYKSTFQEGNSQFVSETKTGSGKRMELKEPEGTKLGRFPANLIHDGSDEVMKEFEKYGHTKSRIGKIRSASNEGIGEAIFKGGFTTCEYNDEGSVARFFYCSKTSTAERNMGLGNIQFGSLEIIVYICENNNDTQIWTDKITIQEDVKVKRWEVMEASVRKAIEEYGIQMRNASEWNTILFGNKILEQYLMDTRYTTKMTISSTTVQQTLNLLRLYITKESTQDVFSKMMDGGNPVVNVDNSNTLTIIMNEKMEFHRGVNPVVLKMQLKINEKESNNFHSTVKPVKLMSYLINLIMPPTGIVLDPFMGSGSTGIAALLNGYDFIGIEQDNSYIDIAKARMEKYEEYRRFLK